MRQSSSLAVVHMSTLLSQVDMVSCMAAFLLGGGGVALLAASRERRLAVNLQKVTTASAAYKESARAERQERFASEVIGSFLIFCRSSLANYTPTPVDTAEGAAFRLGLRTGAATSRRGRRPARHRMGREGSGSSSSAGTREGEAGRHWTPGLAV